MLVKVEILTFLPLIVTISSLFAYFSKVYMLHSLKGQPDAEMWRALGAEGPGRSAGSQRENPSQNRCPGLYGSVDHSCL